MLSPESQFLTPQEAVKELKKITRQMQDLEQFLIELIAYTENYPELHRVRHRLREDLIKINNRLSGFNQHFDPAMLEPAVQLAHLSLKDFIDLFFKIDMSSFEDFDEIFYLNEIDKMISSWAESLQAVLIYVKEEDFHFRRRNWFQINRDMVSIIRHEINNPLQGVIGYHQLMKMRNRRFYSHSNPEISSLNLHIENILNLAEEMKTFGNIMDDLPYETVVFRFKKYFYQLGSEAKKGFDEAEIIVLERKTLGYLSHERDFVLQSFQILPDINPFVDVYLQDREMKMESISLGLFVKQTALQLDKAQSKNSKRVFFDGVDLEVTGNQNALKHVLKNMARNAFEHGRASEVHFTVFQEENKAVIEVENDVGPEGKYIKPHWLQTVWDNDDQKEQRLFLERYSTSAEDGREHGIGLKLSWSLIQMMGGSIVAESDSRKTRFYIILPLKGEKIFRTGSGRLTIAGFRKKIRETPANPFSVSYFPYERAL